jgi:hypothetical protein
VPIVLKSGSLNLLEPSGPVKACNGIALPLPKCSIFDLHGSVHLGNMCIFDCKSDDMHTDLLCIIYYTVLAVRVLGAICIHNQEHKLQSTAVGTCDCYGVLEVG